jgi:hypothetical protein
MKAFRRFLRRRMRAVVVGAAMFLMLSGLASLFTGRVSYHNYWGGLVFAPLTIVLGILLLYIATFRFDRIGIAWRDKKGETVRFPANDFRKW